MGPLSHLKILDFTQMMTGPMATMLLADYGADVIKVESPDGDPFRKSGEATLGGDGVFFLSLNRNKRGIIADMKTPEGREAVLRLAREADVIVENFRPGLAQKLGIDYDQLKEENPGLIYCSITGFGPTGPHSHRPALDQIIQAISGVMQVTGTKDSGPLKTGFPFADLVTALLATVGILTAVTARTTSGKGQRIDLSMMDASVFSIVPRDIYYDVKKDSPPLTGNEHWDIVPNNTYRTSDGRDIMVISINDKFWTILARALGLDDMVTDERFATKGARLKNRAALDRRVADAFATKTMAEWDALLSAAGAIYGPVRTWNEVFSDPEVVDNMIHELDHPLAGKLRFVGNPIRMSDTPAEMRTASPVLGQHTEEILAATGWPTRKLQTAAE